jgi:hypothetical protein
MTRGDARWRFLMLTAAIGVVLVLAVAQVPQPWRGVLVAWLIFGGSVGYLATRLARHYHAYVAPPPTRQPRRTRARRLPEETPRRAESLKIIVSNIAANGRRTI